ncbi:MAG: hypothetical protein ACF8MJ_03085 [Phycisphaerales bacterium JB050]
MRCILNLVVLSAFALLVGGCAPIEGRTSLLRGASVASPIGVEQVAIVTEQAESDRYQPVAFLQYRTPGDNFDGSAERVLIERLKKEAASIGADALLDLTIMVEETGTETVVTEYRYGDGDRRDRDWGSTTTTARIRTGTTYRTVMTATASRRR